jgi:hypothetical protein
LRCGHKKELNKRVARLLVWAFIIILALLTIPQLAQAQVLYGSLTGNVTDQAGAVVPGSQVELMNVGTGATKTATTDENGTYLFSDIQPGLYKVTISAKGFKTLVQEDVRIEANNIRRLDAQMQVGAVDVSVSVVASSVALQTDRADVNVVQTTRQINDLPLAGSAGRNYQSLMLIVPGATLAGEQNSEAGSPQRSISFNVNGVSRLQNNTRLEGSSIQYPWLPTNTAYVPPAEAIETVNVVTNSFDAEQGIAGGAAINVLLKSGTNDFHGTAWWYHTNSSLRARNYFQITPQNPKDILNQFGYAVGGPIWKNKLFFFTDLERTTRRRSGGRAFTVAPAFLRPNGQGVDFSSLIPAGTDCNVTPVAGCIYDPASNPDPALRTAFPGNIIPQNRIDLAALELIRRLPLPSIAGVSNNYATTGVAQFNRTNIDTKINYNYSDKLQFVGRYSVSPTLIFDPPGLGEAGGDAVNGGQLGNAPGLIQVAGFGVTYTFTPNLLLDVNVGYTRQRLGAEATDIDTKFGLEVLRIPGTNGPDRLQGGQPSFQITGWSNLGNANTGNPFLFRDNQYVVNVNFSWLRGSHSFRFGWDYQNQQLNHFQPQGGTFQTARGTFQFNGNATARQGGVAANLYNSWAAFLLGLPSGAGKVVQLRNPNAVYMETHAFYARDHWQLTRKLTFTYGLRWEYYPWPTRDNGIGVSRFDPNDGNVYIGGLSGVPMDTGTDVNGQFLPRIGIAYRLNEKTVLRAGYGQTADPKPYIDFRNAFPINFAWSHPAIVFNGATNNFIPVTTLRLGLNEAAFGTPPDINQGIVRLPTGAGTTTFPKEELRKYIQSWNLTVQRELPWNFVGQVAYVGTRALGQQGFININASAPGTGNAGRPLSRFGIVSDINMQYLRQKG